MRRRTYFIIGVVVALSAALTVGLAVASGQEGTSLAALTPTELMVKVAEEAPNTTAVSGDVAWVNDLLGPVPLLLPGADAGLASFLQSGSGRFWYQDGRLRLESQGFRGDTVAVLNGTTAWVYSSESGTATEYTLPSKPEGSSGEGATDDAGTKAEDFASIDVPQKIQEMVDRLAPDAVLTVSTGTVAGRDSYILTMTPTAANTVVGSAQAAFDGNTFLPLRAQVFAKGDAEPLVELGFTKVSYDEVSADVFEFTPPSGAVVEQSTLTMPADMAEAMKGADGPGDGDAGADADEQTGHTELTLDEAAAKAGFAPAVPSDPALPFQGAAVVDMPAMDGSMMSAMSGTSAEAVPMPADTLEGPVIVLRYGEGFGTVMLAEVQVPDALWTQATTALSQVPIFGTPTDIGGHQAYRLTTKLGSIVVWRQGDLVILMGGAVSLTDLETFAASIDE